MAEIFQINSYININYIILIIIDVYGMTINNFDIRLIIQ